MDTAGIIRFWAWEEQVCECLKGRNRTNGPPLVSFCDGRPSVVEMLARWRKSGGVRKVNVLSGSGAYRR
ncbi:hypothetical protein Ddc_02776 [Ditylenchus destructor]|nr:hypothetical protein Ddc_02776 [Ditylenchus destructor]